MRKLRREKEFQWQRWRQSRTDGAIRWQRPLSDLTSDCHLSSIMMQRSFPVGQRPVFVSNVGKLTRARGLLCLLYASREIDKSSGGMDSRRRWDHSHTCSVVMDSCHAPSTCTAWKRRMRSGLQQRAAEGFRAAVGKKKKEARPQTENCLDLHLSNVHSTLTSYLI